MSDEQNYCGLPWKAGGRTREGVDCVGLAQLWLREAMGIEVCPPATEDAEGQVDAVLKDRIMPGILQRGDVIFFRNTEAKRIRHVGVHLGNGRILHTIQGDVSRIDNSFVLLRRMKLEPAAVVPGHEVETLCRAMADPGIGEGIIIGLIIMGVMTALSGLTKPTLPKNKQHTGRYGFQDLLTQQSSEIPLPELFGRIAVAGNMVYQTVGDKLLTITDPTTQRSNKVVILGTGPIEAIDNLQINGLAFSSSNWYPPNGGMIINPAQTKAEAVTGTIAGNPNRSSISVYLGEHAINVPVDIRAHYDRDFPVYGFNGCSYLVFRLIDANKFQQGFNVLSGVRGLFCREFDADGFITDSTGDSPVADGTATRFKLSHSDIKTVTLVRVGALGAEVTFSEMSAANQTGNVYWVNKTKGYIELLTPPTAGHLVNVNYTYYQRSFTDNAARLLVYLLTENIHGRGWPEDRINWPAALALHDYCYGVVNWTNTDGTSAFFRYITAYAVDARRPIEEHIRAILDSCYGYLFLSQGKVVMKARAAGASVFSFTKSNMLADSFRCWELPFNERPNRVQLFYHSDETFSAQTGVQRDDDRDQAKRASRGNQGIVPAQVEFLAVGLKQQAERMAEVMLRESVNRRAMAEWVTTVKALPLEPGDIVDVTPDERPSWVAKLMRIESIEIDENDRYRLTVSEYFEGAYI